MIQNHYIEGFWRRLAPTSDLNEINIYETCIGKDRRLRLRPLIKNSLTLNDVFREIYSKHWMRFLGVEEINESAHRDIGDLLLQEYDCSNIIALSKQMEVKYCALKDLEKLASRGICCADEIICMCSDEEWIALSQQLYSSNVDERLWVSPFNCGITAQTRPNVLVPVALWMILVTRAAWRIELGFLFIF